jgi:hypothetical protein
MTERLDAFARRLRDDPTFLASAMQAYASSEGLDGAGLAAFIGCRPQQLGRLGLCRRPAGDHFRKDVSAIAQRFSLREEALVEVVRRAEVLEALRGATQSEEILAAARDREEVDE